MVCLFFIYIFIFLFIFICSLVDTQLQELCLTIPHVPHSASMAVYEKILSGGDLPDPSLASNDGPLRSVADSEGNQGRAPTRAKGRGRGNGKGQDDDAVGSASPVQQLEDEEIEIMADWELEALLEQEIDANGWLDGGEVDEPDGRMEV